MKISVQKSFLRDQRIGDIIEEMRTVFADTLVIPYPGDSRADTALIGELRRQNSDFDPNHSLFLIVDHSFDAKGQSRGNRHFIMCYDQEYINRNPFHLFDENKPAWFDHTTLPHTLAGAMINISRPYWPKQDAPISICDCFVGSGTILLEAAKYTSIESCGIDYEPISPLLVEDNLRFFAASESELRSHMQQLRRISDHLAERVSSTLVAADSWKLSIAGKALNKADEVFELWSRQRDIYRPPESTNELVVALRGVDPLCRLLFYTRLKASRRYAKALAQESVDPAKVFRKELDDLYGMLEQLSRLRLLTESGTNGGQISRYLDAYSEGLTLDRAYLSEMMNMLPEKINIARCEDWEPKASFDLIVSDPPYGFNTDEDTDDLAVLYASFLSKVIGALSGNGQLVLALPDWSHTGRHLPAIILKDFVINQILMIAEEKGLEVIQPAVQVPQTVGSAPYYWESEKALRRAILHFRFRTRPSYQRSTHH